MAKKSDDGIRKLQKDAAELIGITSRQLGKLKMQPGFPARDDGQFDTVTIAEWMATLNQDDEDDADDEFNDAGVEFVDVVVRVPVCEPQGHISQETLRNALSQHVDFHIRDERQLMGLRYGHMGCRDSHTQFEDGRHVDRISDFIKYILGQIGDGVQAQLDDVEHAAAA